MTKIECNAIIFDMDGTLIDTTDCIESVWHRWGAKYNVEIKEILHGRTAMETLRIFAPHLATDDGVNELGDMALDEIHNVRPIPGIKEFIAKLPENSWTIATSATEEVARACLKHVGVLLPSKMITAEKVSNGKPHPEPFLKAAELLNITCDKCVVFEDSLAGIEAGRKSGAVVVGLATTHPEHELKSADYIIKNFNDVSVEVGENKTNGKIILSI